MELIYPCISKLKVFIRHVKCIPIDPVLNIVCKAFTKLFAREGNQVLLHGWSMYVKIFTGRNKVSLTTSFDLSLRDV